MNVKLEIYSDGGARGNPGPAAAAYLILSENGEVLKAESRYLGCRTNNQAEYEALIAALKAAAVFKPEEVTCRLDSELVCKQLNGEYEVKNSELHKLNDRVTVLKGCFKKVRFVNVPRTHRFICEADRLVNDRLDREAAIS